MRFYTIHVALHAPPEHCMRYTTINYAHNRQNKQKQPYSDETGSSAPPRWRYTAYPAHSVSTEIFIRQSRKYIHFNLPQKLKTKNYGPINSKRTPLRRGSCGVLHYKVPAEPADQAAAPALGRKLTGVRFMRRSGGVLRLNET